jgi:hypothetical protein
MAGALRHASTLFAAVGALVIGGCGSPSVPSGIPSGNASQAGQLSPLSGSDSSPEPKVSALSQGLSDITLSNAGWACIQPGNGLTLCAPPGTGLPPLPPTGDGHASYDIMAFTLDHQFVHHVKLLRPDLYHGEPCLGGDPWSYLAVVGYYECIIPGHGD